MAATLAVGAALQLRLPGRRPSRGRRSLRAPPHPRVPPHPWTPETLPPCARDQVVCVAAARERGAACAKCYFFTRAAGLLWRRRKLGGERRLPTRIAGRSGVQAPWAPRRHA